MALIILDYDDTLTDFVPHWIMYYNIMFDDELDWETITEWDVTKFAKHGKKVFDVLKDKEVISTVPILPYAQEYVEKMHKAGHDVQIVTATHPEVFSTKYKHFRKHFGFLPERSFSCVYNKYMIQGDYMVDDNPDNFKLFSGISFLIDRPWNRENKVYEKVDNMKNVWYNVKTIEERREDDRKFFENIFG